jgi:hypothetical protein
MVAMVALCGTRIRYSRLLIHPVSGVLADGVEEGGDSSGRRFHGVVDLVQSMYGTSLVLEALDLFKGSMATISALGRWSLGACARRLPDCQADSGMGAATAARQRLTPAAVMVVRWSKDLTIIFIMFGLPYSTYELME